ncbi:MAG: hypothetical protein LBG97_06675 [Coriobacteriales bacterium]|jgi:hypothetical protein|nr:hypothetical protein [Coriobacteriales bacterium]
MDFDITTSFVMRRAQAELLNLGGKILRPEHVLLGLLKYAFATADDVAPTSCCKQQIDYNIKAVQKMLLDVGIVSDASSDMLRVYIVAGDRVAGDRIADDRIAGDRIADDRAAGKITTDTKIDDNLIDDNLIDASKNSVDNQANNELSLIAKQPFVHSAELTEKHPEGYTDNQALSEQDQAKSIPVTEKYIRMTFSEEMNRITVVAERKADGELSNVIWASHYLEALLQEPTTIIRRFLKDCMSNAAKNLDTVSLSILLRKVVDWPDPDIESARCVMMLLEAGADPNFARDDKHFQTRRSSGAADTLYEAIRNRVLFWLSKSSLHVDENLIRIWLMFIAYGGRGSDDGYLHLTLKDGRSLESLCECLEFSFTKDYDPNFYLGTLHIYDEKGAEIATYDEAGGATSMLANVLSGNDEFCAHLKEWRNDAAQTLRLMLTDAQNGMPPQSSLAAVHTPSQEIVDSWEARKDLYWDDVSRQPIYKNYIQVYPELESLDEVGVYCLLYSAQSGHNESQLAALGYNESKPASLGHDELQLAEKQALLDIFILGTSYGKLIDLRTVSAAVNLAVNVAAQKLMSQVRELYTRFCLDFNRDWPLVVKLALRTCDGDTVFALEFPPLDSLRHFSGDPAGWKFEEWLMAMRQTDMYKENDEGAYRPYETIRDINETGFFSRRRSVFGTNDEERAEFFRLQINEALQLDCV